MIEMTYEWSVEDLLYEWSLNGWEQNNQVDGLTTQFKNTIKHNKKDNTDFISNREKKE